LKNLLENFFQTNVLPYAVYSSEGNSWLKVNKSSYKPDLFITYPWNFVPKDGGFIPILTDDVLFLIEAKLSDPRQQDQSQLTFYLKNLSRQQLKRGQNESMRSLASGLLISPSLYYSITIENTT
jgi:hypothetical protein